MTADLSGYFDRFVKSISLDKRRLSRMDSAAGILQDFLVKEYGLVATEVFLQGSYPNHTVIEPIEGGEYDIDLCAVCVDGNVTGDVALDDLERRLAADGRYADRIVRKTPCVRLEYSEDEVGKFHVDVVPLRRLPGTSTLQAPRRSSPWKETAPQQYTDWCRDRGALFVRTVKILKRWRDEQQSVHDAIKSILLQVLVAGSMPQVDDDAARIAATLRNLHGQLSTLSAPPKVPNPVLPFENLAERWSVKEFSDFVSELGEAVRLITDAEAAGSLAEAADAWRELLGPDFPNPTPSELGLSLGDTSHEKKPESRGWVEALDSRYSVSVTAERSTRRSGRGMKRLRSGDPSPTGRDLRFRATVVAPEAAEVCWQVVNTGRQAKEDDGLRGEIIDGRDRLGNPLRGRTEDWETTKYVGVHEIRALLVQGNRVVARSEYFKVPIFNGRQR